MHDPKPIRWAAVCCLLFSASALLALTALFTLSFIATPSVQASSLQGSASSNPDQAQAPIVVRFDGAAFSAASLAATTADGLQIWNDAGQSYMLRAELQAAPVAANASLYLPVVMNPSGGSAKQAQPTRFELDFAAGKSITIYLQPAGHWQLALVDANGNPVDGATLDVTVTAAASGNPTVTPTPVSPTPASPTPASPTPASPTPASPTPTPTATTPAVPGGQGKTEWTYHRSADGAHPDGNEQQMVWLMNRARANPAAEGAWLAQSTLPQIANPRGYFHVDLNVLQREFAGYAAKPPAAFDIRLYNAAQAHSLDLIARDAQDHTGQFDRITAAGFQYTSARGSVFAYADSALGAHGSFNIDYGSDADGMQVGRGHRMAIMAIDGDYTNVGIAMVPESNSATQVGPLVTTGNYARANSSIANEYNRFFVGAVWSDRNGNSLYDPGEGLGGVTVVPDSGDYYAVTGAAGGFAIPALNPGTYKLHFYVGGGLDRTVTVADASVLVDVMVPGQAAAAAGQAGAEQAGAEQAGAGQASAGLAGAPRLPAPPVQAGATGAQ